MIQKAYADCQIVCNSLAGEPKRNVKARAKEEKCPKNSGQILKIGNSGKKH